MSDRNLSFFVHQNLFNLARRLLKQLPAALKNAQIYPLDHPYFTHSLQLVQDSLDNLFKYQQEITFSLVENELYFGDTALVEDSLNQRQFIKEFEQRHISNLTFLPGVTRDELIAFMQILAQVTDEPASPEDLLRRFKEREITHILLGEVLLSGGGTGGGGGLGTGSGGGGGGGGIGSGAGSGVGDYTIFSLESRRRAQGIYFGSISVIKKIMNDVESDREFTLDQVRAVIGEIVGLVIKDERYLLGLTTIKNYDEYTYNHSVNVALLALYLGKLLGLSNEQLSILGEAAMLHDVGKVKIPKSILNKAGVLSPEEWKIMEKHALEGAEILSQISGIHDLSISVAFEHHLHYDLSGYPEVSGVREVNPFSRLVTICDVYDAATSLRVYHAPVLGARIIAMILSKKGTFFDPVMAKAFVQMMGIYPVGSLVRLDTDELAVVYANNLHNILRPQVTLVSETDKTGALNIVNLEEIEKESMTFKRTIREVLSAPALNIEVTKYFMEPGTN